MAKEKSNILNPNLFFVSLVFFIASLILLIFGFNSIRNKNSIEEINIESNNKQNEQSEESISELFKGVERGPGLGELTDEEYYQADPFKDVCDETTGDGKPSIKSGTVCYR